MKSFVNICLVDDNPADLEQLKTKLESLMHDHDFVCSISTFDSLKVFKESGLNPRLLFMDVELDQESGLQAASQIHHDNPDCIIVLMSSFPHYSVDGYRTGAVRFLPKPFETQRMEAILDDAFFKSLVSAKTIWHPDLYEKPIPVNVLIYVEARDRQTDAHFIKGRVIQTPLTLKVWKELTANVPFIQVYKSILVNPAWIEDLNTETKEVVLKSGQKVPFSRHFKKSIEAELQEYIWSSL